MNSEIEKIKSAYEKRKNIPQLYDLFNDFYFESQTERRRELIKLLRKKLRKSRESTSILEVGCGNGANIRELIELGFLPENISANELLIDRVTDAKHKTSPAVNIEYGNALNINYKQKYDIVYQSTVFSSLPTHEMRKDLALIMLDLIKPGGAILWYDFIYNNPNNKDVFGISIKELKTLFPNSSIEIKKLTLAPPLGRAICKIHPSLYRLLNKIPFLRTHIICWIKKNNEY